MVTYVCSQAFVGLHDELSRQQRVRVLHCRRQTAGTSSGAGWMLPDVSESLDVARCESLQPAVCREFSCISFKPILRKLQGVFLTGTPLKS